MECVRFTPERMARRVARFQELEPVDFAGVNDAGPSDGLPREAAEIIEFGHSRQLYSVIGLDSAITQGAPIDGAGGMTMTFVACLPGAGAALHAHVATHETFTVLRGRFEVTYNDDGSGRLVLDRFDVVSIPPGVVRAFRNVSDEEGILQVVVTGGVHDRADLDFAPAVADELRSHGDEVLAHFEHLGFTFTASDAVEPSA